MPVERIDRVRIEDAEEDCVSGKRGIRLTQSLQDITHRKFKFAQELLPIEPFEHLPRKAFFDIENTFDLLSRCGILIEGQKVDVHSIVPESLTQKVVALALVA